MCEIAEPGVLKVRNCRYWSAEKCKIAGIGVLKNEIAGIEMLKVQKCRY